MAIMQSNLYCFQLDNVALSNLAYREKNHKIFNYHKRTVINLIQYSDYRRPSESSEYLRQTARSIRTAVLFEHRANGCAREPERVWCALSSRTFLYADTHRAIHEAFVRAIET